MDQYIEKATQNLTLDELTDFAIRYRKAKKDIRVVYLWWLIFGAVGGHRFYLGHYGTGFILLFITVFTLGIGAVIGWYDVLNIPRLTEQANHSKVLNLVKVVKRK